MSRYVVHSLQDMVHCMLKILHTSRDQCLHCIPFPKKESQCLEPGHLHKSLSGSGAQVISPIPPFVKPRQGDGFVVTSTFPSPFLAYCVDDIDHITGHKKEGVWDMVTSTSCVFFASWFGGDMAHPPLPDGPNYCNHQHYYMLTVYMLNMCM